MKFFRFLGLLLLERAFVDVVRVKVMILLACVFGILQSICSRKGFLCLKLADLFVATLLTRQLI